MGSAIFRVVESSPELESEGSADKMLVLLLLSRRVRVLEVVVCWEERGVVVNGKREEEEEVVGELVVKVLLRI